MFPNYDSSEVFATVNSAVVGDVVIRRGYYCVPTSGSEAVNGIGFGLDKVQNRHYIGRPQDGWSRAEALKAVSFVLKAPAKNVTLKADGWGQGYNYNFKAWANGGTGCPPGGDPQQCQNKVSIPVIAASTEGGAANDPQAGMPAGTPLGLQTVYCDYGIATMLRCDIWVTAALLRTS